MSDGAESGALTHRLKMGINWITPIYCPTTDRRYKPIETPEGRVRCNQCGEYLTVFDTWEAQSWKHRERDSE